MMLQKIGTMKRNQLSSVWGNGGKQSEGKVSWLFLDSRLGSIPVINDPPGECLVIVICWPIRSCPKSAKLILVFGLVLGFGLVSPAWWVTTKFVARLFWNEY